MNRTIVTVAAVFSASSLLLVDSAVKGTVLLAFAAVVALILRRDSAATRHLVWLLAIVAMLVVPLLSAMLPQWRVLPAWASHSPEPAVVEVSPPSIVRPAEVAVESPATSAAVEVERPISMAERPAVPMPESPVAIATPKINSESMAGSWNWITALPLVWAIGFCVLVLRLSAARWLLWNSERRATVVCRRVAPQLAFESRSDSATANDPIVTAMDTICSQLGISRPVTLLIHPEKTIPVVWGILRCRLMLPAAARQWGDEQLRSVLLHELAHIKRRDTIVQLLAQVACALHWFNPLVWFAAWRLDVERERSCDDLVLASGVRPSAYAGHLLEVVTGLSPARWTQACGLAMARKSSLEGRLTAVLGKDLNRRSVSVALAGLALAVAVGIAVPIAMLRAAQPVDPKTDATAVKAEPKDAKSKALFESWKTSARSDGKIPGGRIGEMAASLKSYMDLNPGSEAAAKCEAVFKKCDATHDWTPAEAVALLDEIEVVAPSRAEWAMLTNIERQIHPGKPLPAELKDAPWGSPEVKGQRREASSVALRGLRMAWLLEPREETHPLGSVMKSRVLFHNTARVPVCFATENWIQSGTHVAKDANGKEITVWATQRLGRRTRMIFRLAPGEYAEVEGHGIGVGSHETATGKSIPKPSAWIEAKEGDLVTFTPGTLHVSFQTWQNNEGRKDSKTVWNEMIAARVAQEGPMPASVADRRQLLHRVWQYLFGTAPPVDESVRTFEMDNEPDALARLTTRLQQAAQSMHIEGDLTGGETKFKVIAKAKPKQGVQLKPATEQKLKWGEPVNGLRMALAWPPALGEPGMGAEPEFYLVVQNVSQDPVRLITGAAAPNPRKLTLQDETPVSRTVDDTPIPGDWLLQPREAAFLRLFPSQEKLKDGRSWSEVKEQIVRVQPQYSYTAEMSIEKAPVGAWTGKLVTGKTRGSADVAAAPAPMHKDARSLYEIWKRHARGNGDIPGALIGELAGSVKQFIKYNPTWETVPKLNELLPRLDATHDWKPADAIALLDEVAAIKDSPLSMAIWKGTRHTIRQGEALPKKFADAPWGEAQPNGLRAAWVLEPSAAEHRIGTAMKARLLVQNRGQVPVMLQVPTFHQGGVKANDAKGAEVEVSGIDWLTLAALEPVRLAPAEYIEISTPGVGLGPRAGMGPWAGPRVGSNVLAKPGDELTLTHGLVPLDGSEVGVSEDDPHVFGPGWWLAHIQARLSKELPLPADAAERTRLFDRAVRELFVTAPSAEETAAFIADKTPDALDSLAKRLAARADVVSFSGKLPTAPVKFRVLAADANADKQPRVALGPGEYPLPSATATRGDATLKIVGRPVGDRRTNDAQLIFEATEFTGARPPDPHKLEVPDGWGTWAIVCRPSDGYFYLLHKGHVRKIDYSAPRKVTDTPANDLPAEFRDEVKRQLEIAGVSDAQQAEMFEKPAAPATSVRSDEQEKPKTAATEPQPKKAAKEPLTAWGEEVNGVQIGARLGEQRVYEVGESATLILRLRNNGKVQVPYLYGDEYFLKNPPLITDASGKAVTIKAMSVFGFAQLKSVAPGKEVDLVQLKLDLRPATERSKDAAWTIYGTGKFRIQFPVADVVGEAFPPDLPGMKFTTGKLELEVKEPFTAWGQEVGGLQAGLGFKAGEMRAYTHGETVTLIVRVRNVGQKEIKFQYYPKFLSENSPTVLDETGKRVSLRGNMLHLVKRDIPKEVNLAVGKEIELYERVLRLAKGNEDAGELKTRDIFPTGKFLIQHEQVIGNSAQASDKLDPALSKLATGTLELEIKPVAPVQQEAPKPKQSVQLERAMLEGTWAGEKDGVKVDLNFLWKSEHQQVGWKLQTPDAGIGTQMSVVMEPDGSAAKFVFRKGLEFEATLGRVTLGERSSLQLELIPNPNPDATKYPAVKDLVLTRQPNAEKQKAAGGALLKPATEQKLKWGEPVNGLRMSLAWPPSLGEPSMGDAEEFYLVVQNVSQAAVRLTTGTAAPNPRRLNLMRRLDPNDETILSSRTVDDVPVPGDWLLKPRESALVRLIHSDEKMKDGRTFSAVKEHIVSVQPQYSYTADMTIEKAPAGAWTGKLTTGETRGSADVPPPKSGVPLAEQTWPMPPWGAEKEGLSAGIRVIGEARIGGEVQAELWVRNSGAKDVTFSQCPRADFGLHVVAQDKDGKEHSADITQFLGKPVLTRLLLPAGNIVKIKEFTMKLGAKKDGERVNLDLAALIAARAKAFSAKMGGERVNLDLPPGEYKLRAVWSDTTSRVAPEGELTGKLTTGEVDFKLATANAGADAGKPGANIVKLPDAEYAKDGFPLDELAGEGVMWNGEESGLSLGYRITGDEWRILGKEVKVELWVRNAGKEDVKFQILRRTDEGLRVKLNGNDGKEHFARMVPSDVPLFGMKHLLSAGQCIKVNDFSVGLLPPEQNARIGDELRFFVPPGWYQFVCEVKVPGFTAANGDRKQTVPGAGEWTSTISTRSLNVEVIAQDAPAPKPRVEHVRVRIRKDGEVSLDGKKMSLDELKTRAARYAKKWFTIEANDDVRYAKVVEVVEALKAVGVSEFSFAEARVGDGKYRVANRTSATHLDDKHGFSMCRPSDHPQWFTVSWPAEGERPACWLRTYPNTNKQTEGKWAVVWEPGTNVLWWVDDSDVGKMTLTDPARVIVDREGRTNNFSRDFGLPEEVKTEFRRLGFVIGRDKTPGRETAIGGNTGGQSIVSAEFGAWSVTGTVTDAAGKPLADVSVRLTTNQVLKTEKTNAKGEYYAAFTLPLQLLAHWRGVTVEPVLEGFTERDMAKSGEFNVLLRAGEEPQHVRLADDKDFQPGPIPRFAERDLLPNQRGGVPGKPGRADFVMLKAAK